MNIRINGEARRLDAPCTLTQLLESLDLAGRRLAVERNGDIVPRSAYADTLLAEGDHLEIVHAIGGG